MNRLNNNNNNIAIDGAVIQMMIEKRFFQLLEITENVVTDNDYAKDIIFAFITVIMNKVDLLPKEFQLKVRDTVITVLDLPEEKKVMQIGITCLMLIYDLINANLD